MVLTAVLGLGAVGAISKEALLSKAACFGCVHLRGFCVWGNKRGLGEAPARAVVQS